MAFGKQMETRTSWSDSAEIGGIKENSFFKNQNQDVLNTEKHIKHQ